MKIVIGFFSRVVFATMKGVAKRQKFKQLSTDGEISVLKNV
jgi:hypothetical protein